MRKQLLLNSDWVFSMPGKEDIQVQIPHTWNATDGQDGGDDYWRGTCTYRKEFSAPEFNRQTQRVYLEFAGVNASAKVVLNRQEVMTHDGGYSTFRGDVTELLQEENCLTGKIR